jgi:hypothetical protein
MTDFLLASTQVADSMFALNGEDAVGVVVADGGEWADGLDEISDVEAFELAGASYTRLEGTFTVARISDAWRLFVEGFTAIDTSDSDDRVGLWLATADGKLIGYEPDPAGPSGSYLPAWPDGTHARPIAPISLAGGGVQSVTGTGVDDTDPANPVITAGVASVSGTAVDDTDPANPVIDVSGVQEITAGTGVTVTGTATHPIISATAGGEGAAGIVEVDLSAETGSWVECNLSELPVAGTYRVEPPADVDCTIEFVYPDMLTRPPTVIIIGSSPVKVGVYSPPIPQVNRPKTLLVTPSSAGGGRHGAWLDPIWWDGVSVTDGQTLEIVDGAPAWVTP